MATSLYICSPARDGVSVRDGVVWRDSGGAGGGDGMGLRHRRSPITRTPGVLHVEEQRGRAAPRRLTLTPFGVFPRFLALLAANREGQRAQTLLCDFFSAIEAVAVVALFEPHERIVDLVERLRLHLDERQLDVFLDIGLRAFDGVEHVAQLADFAGRADIAHLALHLGLQFAPTI